MKNNEVEVLKRGEFTIVKYGGNCVIMEDIFYLPEEYIICSDEDAYEAVIEFLDS